MKNLINWNELSRYLGLSRDAIRKNRISKKHWPALDKLFKQDLPEWWEKEKISNTP
jgi:hypothetical protein